MQVSDAIQLNSQDNIETRVSQKNLWNDAILRKSTATEKMMRENGEEMREKFDATSSLSTRCYLRRSAGKKHRYEHCHLALLKIACLLLRLFAKRVTGYRLHRQVKFLDD